MKPSCFVALLVMLKEVWSARRDAHIPTTFYEDEHGVKTESSQWFPARKRFNLLAAGRCLDDPGNPEHGIGSHGGIFSGSRVKTAP
jgi:hypothetical protein